MAAKKRAPGAGRKPQGDYSNLSDRTFSIRLPEDIRQRLDDARARRRGGAGWSLNQEIARRLMWSFDQQREDSRDPAARALGYLLQQVIETVATNVAPRAWRTDPFAFRTLKLAFDQILDALMPPGEIKTPDLREEDKNRPFLGDVRPWVVSGLGGGLGGGRIGGTTPEDVARFTRDVIFSCLMPTRAPAGFLPQPLTPEQEEFAFDYADARRALEIKQDRSRQ